MSTALVLIHGRSQQMPRELRHDADRVAAHVTAKRRSWLSGLTKGLVLARQAPIPESQAFFPFYGNTFADLIDQHVQRGGRAPNLELAADPAVVARQDLILEAAQELGFDAERELAYDNPELAQEAARRGPALELGWGDALRVSVVRSALQFLGRKTGVPEWIIEEFMDDVAYYLEDRNMRDAVLAVALEEVDRARQDHDDIVVVGHSLGSVVAYDLLQDPRLQRPVRLLVTAGSPLGYSIVQKNLQGLDGRGGKPPVPPVEPLAGGPHWVNAYDVRDVVALVHPLGDRFTDGTSKIRDEITHNPSGAHSIEDYLADPDVAGPLGAAVQRP
jgi:PGAP1-like protein